MQNTVRFILDERVIELDFIKAREMGPTMTVLNYLRSLPGHQGVKEGCAEGDCGACTVVVAEQDRNGNLTYKALDSCLLFLPMIHGKQLITVENLAILREGEKVLHPVQQGLVETNGSQCGYCTPGIVMSLFGLYKNHHSPSREVINDALTGNLCRCTGYRSIAEAAEKACRNHGKDHFSEKEAEIAAILKKITQNRETLILVTEKQSYFRPFTLEEALRIRAENPCALIVSGATDVALRQTKKREILPEILDLSGLEELKFHKEDDEICTFGAGLSLEEVKSLTKERYPALYEMLKVFGSLQIRNAGTIGGNVGSASPIGDTLPVLFAHRAKLVLQSAVSERIVNIENFIKGYRKTDLRDDELISGVIVPKLRGGAFIRSFKVSKRKDLDISTVCASFRLELEDGRVKEIICAFGGMSAWTRRASQTERFLQGREWTRRNLESAMKILGKEFKPISDTRSGAHYRSILAENLLLKFYLETVNLDK